MIVTLLIASLAVVLRFIRQARWKRTRLTRAHHAGCMYPSPVQLVASATSKLQPDVVVFRRYCFVARS
jgi:hypothetical protein